MLQLVSYLWIYADDDSTFLFIKARHFDHMAWLHSGHYWWPLRRGILAGDDKLRHFIIATLLWKKWVFILYAMTYILMGLLLFWLWHLYCQSKPIKLNHSLILCRIFHWSNHMTVPVLVKLTWRIWLKCIGTTLQHPQYESSFIVAFYAHKHVETLYWRYGFIAYIINSS